MKMLEGLTVLDLTRLLPGPLATQHFADHGARVIKIEDVNRGDYARQDMAIGVSMSHLFHILNRGKESLALDLSRDEGKNIFLTLCKSADIVVENFRPGAMDRLKLGYEDVRKIKPDIIFCAISAFGANSDNREKAAHDINICALSGVSDQMGSGECGPALSNFQVADIAGGALPAINAILTALFHRERTGKGAFLDISMAGSLFASNVLPYATRETFKRSPERGGDILTGALACYGYYETSDGGWIAVGALEPQFWERFCNLIDRPDLIPARLSLDGATKEAVREIIKSKPKGAWIELLEGTDCCVTPVLTYGEAASQMALTETNSVVIPDPIDGDLSQPINCWNNEGTKPAVRAPRHGEHSRAILLSFGITERNINGFVEDGLIAEPEVSTAD